jgi:hypothetical protein
VAEGDSWFDYPLNDVLSMLEDRHGFDVESVAHKGDTVEDMAYGVGQFDDFARLLEKLLRQERVPDAILLSGGGNDIAGDEFAMLINHVLSGLPPVNAEIVHGLVDVRLRNRSPFCSTATITPCRTDEGFSAAGPFCRAPGFSQGSTRRATGI